MKILMLVDNFPPETNANARIFSELAECWSQADNDISIITSQPNFPRGRLYPGYKNHWYQKEEKKSNYIIRRVKTFMSPNKGVLLRIMDFLSFAINSFFVGLMQKNIDVVIGVTPQLFSALSACVLAKIKRKPYVLFLCDLWPDSVVSVGTMRQSFAIRLMKKLEYQLYKQSDLIVTLSPYFNQYLKKLGIETNKCLYSLSGVNHQLFYPRQKPDHLVSKYQLDNKFVVSYIGNFGAAHNHDAILQVAQSLVQQKNLQFMFIGDGVNRDSVVDTITKQSISNVIVDGPFSADSIADYWALADVALIILRDIETNKTVIPSKMLEAMAMAKPILLYAPDGEAKHLLDESQAGIFVPVGDQDKLAEKVVEFYHSDDMLKHLQNKAQQFAAQYSRTGQADEILNHMNILVKQRAQS